MKVQLIADLNSAKNQLNYVNSALSSNIENWERKEFEAVKQILVSDIDSLSIRIELCK